MKMNILHFQTCQKQDTESDINLVETQHQENSYTPETLQNNTTMHDIYMI